MHVENMKKLIVHLKDAENPTNFNMAVWFRHGLLDIEGTQALQAVMRDHSCDTVACLAGHAVIVAEKELVEKEVKT